MRLIYLSSKTYPSATADGLFMAQAAKAMGHLLGDQFVFVVARSNEPERFSGVALVQSGITGRFRTLRNFLAFPKLRRHFTRDTIIYSNEQPLILIALLWRPFFGYRVVYESHGFFHWRRDQIFLRLWRWWIDGIVATSDSLRELFERLEPKLADRISVVYGGYDPGLFASLPDQVTMRQELGISPDAFVVGYSGHFKTRGEKGLSTLLEALPQVTPQATALLIGGKANEIAEYRTKFPNASCVYKEWTSDQGAALRWLQAADVLVIPTSRDTLYTRYSFPMKAYDYLALGKPAIVSNVPIIREVMTDQVALVCQPGSSTELARAMQKLAIDPDLRERLGDHARQKAVGYTWGHRAKSILHAIQ